jgi:hypothetical protein
VVAQSFGDVVAQSIGDVVAQSFGGVVGQSAHCQRITRLQRSSSGFDSGITHSILRGGSNQGYV